MTTKNGKQYQLLYENIIELKLAVIPMRYKTQIDYISAKTTKGNIRLNILGERIKESNFWNKGTYKSRNVETYYRLKSAFDKYNAER